LRDDDFEYRDRVMDYSYRAHDDSLLGPLIRCHVSVKLLPYIPCTISANALTISGHVAVAFGFLWSMVIGAGPLAGWEAPRWVYLVPAVALAVYLITDDVDGPQARRIGASGPLGDFLDHWLDALAGFLVPLGAFAAYGADPPLTAAFIVLCGLAWWTATAERWVTGELRLPPISDVEMTVIMMAIHLAAAIGGPKVWKQTVLGITLIDGVVWFGVISTVILTVTAAARGGPARRSIPGLMATLVPLGIWYMTALYADLPIAASVLVPLIFGMAIAAHVGEILRRCLIGTRQHPYDKVLIAVGIMLLLSLLPAQLRAPAVVGLITGMAALAIAIHLVHQFAQTVRYIMERRGESLFARRSGGGGSSV
jgi:phosphatidylglycerophosphate synthase